MIEWRWTKSSGYGRSLDNGFKDSKSTCVTKNDMTASKPSHSPKDLCPYTHQAPQAFLSKLVMAGFVSL